MKRQFTSILLVAACAAAPAFAQPQQEGLVTVNVSNVANNLAQNLSVDVSQIPITVQVPVGVAANVCGTSVNALGQQAAGSRTCDATTTSDALNQVVQRQLKRKG